MTTTLPTPNLLVPMNVDALAVGKDSNDWILQVPDFATGINMGNFLGYQQLSNMWNPNPCPYAPGIHLRWALPDGLTHGQQPKNATDPSFPEVPNRWVILRLYTDPSQSPLRPAVRAWMLESDFITEKPPSSGASQWPVLPTTHATTPKTFRYLRYVGRQLDFQDWPAPGTASYLSDIKAQLTAVGYGNATFSAYYPASSTIFGFLDDMGDFPAAETQAPVSVTYLVAGWHFDPKADVLYGYENTPGEPERWQERMEQLSWAWYAGGRSAGDPPPPPPTPQPTRTITHGFVGAIKWTGKDTQYNYGPGNRIAPQLAAGNTSLEALAALAAANSSGKEDQATLEKILVAFQNDVLSVYDKDGGDSSTIDRELNELLHGAAFGSHSGGIAYEIRRRDSDTPASTEPTGDSAPAVDLPTEVGTTLAALNVAQRELQATQSKLASYQREYFLAWHKKADGIEVPDSAFDQLEQRITKAQTELGSQQAQVLTAKTAANHSLANYLPAYELSTRSLGRYWQPSDFTLLVANTGRTFRHGEDGRFTQTGELVCRLSGTTLSALDFTPTSGNSKRPNPVHIPTAEIPVAVPDHATTGSSGDFDAAILPDLGALLSETALLDPNQATYLAETFGANAGISTSLLAGQIQEHQAIQWNAPAQQNLPDVSGYKGSLPSSAAATYWLDNDGNPGNPWIPLLMQWEFDWYPTYESGTGVPKALQSWTFNGTDYELDQSYTAASSPAATFDGITVLTPSAIWNLQKRLEAYNSRNPANPDHLAIADLISALSKIDILSQSVGGSNLALTMLDQSLQLPPISRDTGGLAVANGGGTVVDLIDRRYETAPWAKSALAGDQYFPVRAGHAVLTRINVVDAFGQLLQVPKPVLANPTLSTQLKGAMAGQIELRPRLAQHARLTFDLVSAVDDRVVTGPDPATTPVCGWIVPDYLDNSLLLSSADGAVLGKLRLDAEAAKVLWIPDPVKGGSQHDPAPPIPNAHLAEMQSALLQIPGADFAKLTAYIEQVEETIYPPGSGVNSPVSALMGQPIAVARVALQMELDGLPVYDQSATAADKAEDHGYSEIAFPIALGDLGQTNDGLFGYFAAPLAHGPGAGASDGTDYSILYAASGADVSAFASSYLAQPDACNPPIQLAAYTDGKPSPPACATVLLDPRSQLKAQSGILPAKTVQLPLQDTSAVLASHEIFFQVSPVLGSAASLEIPHPSKKYGTWSWLQLKGDSSGGSWTSSWRETEDFGQRTGKDGLPFYPAMLREGWLRLRVPAASGASILYFSVRGGTYQVPAGTTIYLTWAAKLPDSRSELQLIAGDGSPQSVPNQSPGFVQTIQASTTFTLKLIDNNAALVETQKLTVHVPST